jgi:alcohol dehydrogenase YqhD (iron-dependent ADH family)
MVQLVHVDVVMNFETKIVFEKRELLSFSSQIKDVCLFSSRIIILLSDGTFKLINYYESVLNRLREEGTIKIVVD